MTKEFLEEEASKVNEDTLENLDHVVLKVLKELMASQDFQVVGVELVEMV